MPLIPFYLNQSPDDAGRFLSDIWAFSLDDLEFHHDFIQWLFPLETPSAFNPDAPILDPATIKTFRTTPQIQSNLQKSLDVMLNFYGLKLHRMIENIPLIAQDDNFQARSANWLHPNNHNHLRLTRILRSLHLLGLELESQSLLHRLLALAAKQPAAVTPTTFHFWRSATLDPAVTNDADFRARLGALANMEYAEDFDAAFYHLYIAAPARQRHELRSIYRGNELPRPHRFRNTDFPCRVDVRTAEQLRQRTTFTIMQEASDDCRDDLWGLAWHYHTAKLFGLNPDTYFEELEPLAAPYMRRLMQNFRTRSAAQKAMNHWALYLADSPQGQYIEYRP